MDDIKPTRCFRCDGWMLKFCPDCDKDELLEITIRQFDIRNAKIDKSLANIYTDEKGRPLPKPSDRIQDHE